MTTAELRKLLEEAMAEAKEAVRQRNPALLYEGPTEARWALWRAAAPMLPALLDMAKAVTEWASRAAPSYTHHSDPLRPHRLSETERALLAALAKLEEET